MPRQTQIRIGIKASSSSRKFRGDCPHIPRGHDPTCSYGNLGACPQRFSACQGACPLWLFLGSVPSASLCGNLGVCPHLLSACQGACPQRFLSRAKSPLPKRLPRACPHALPRAPWGLSPDCPSKGLSPSSFLARHGRKENPTSSRNLLHAMPRHRSMPNQGMCLRSDHTRFIKQVTHYFFQRVFCKHTIGIRTDICS